MTLLLSAFGLVGAASLPATLWLGASPIAITALPIILAALL
ncbi:hypothetical protein [Sulfitobacter brevis]|nr:hypothetical protein [Sulfitobacter brevis]